MRRVFLATVLSATLAMLPAAAATATAPERLLAPLGECPGQTEPRAPIAVQEKAMLCLVNAARDAAGRPALAGLGGLHRAAARKSADILRCDEFSHEACGREFTHWIESLAGCRSAAENIAWGSGPLGSPRAIFRAWLNSAGHRANILGPYSRTGLGLRVGSLEGNASAHVWTQTFGAGC